MIDLKALQKEVYDAYAVQRLIKEAA